jgi:CRISPR/Cas system Type II protein with McrA/HNH and RuvC-like nuclease domain
MKKLTGLTQFLCSAASLLSVSLSPLKCQLAYNYHDCAPLSLVYSIYDSTEDAIRKMIEASQKMMINEQHVNSAVNEHFKLQIKMLQNAPRDADKLERLLKIKKREKQEANHIEDTQRLVTEIEMLKVVLHLALALRLAF